MFDFLLDKSIIYSFDRTGYERHAKTYRALPVDNDPGTVLISGGSSGIGKACTDFLLDNNCRCIVTGRDPARFVKRQGLESKVLDLADWDGVLRFCHDLDKVNHLILNAGGMPSNYLENQAGCEYQAASQLIGHLLLFECLHRTGKLQEEARVIFVSSGGMLLKKLDIQNLFQPVSYDRLDQYANVKRAQVIMSRIYADRYPQYHFSAMHPGWVGTRALEEGLPGFFSFFKKRLRTPLQGADTILWLLYSRGLDSGRFWFDREQARTHPLLVTRCPDNEEKALMARVDEYLAAAFSRSSPSA